MSQLQVSPLTSAALPAWTRDRVSPWTKEGILSTIGNTPLIRLTRVLRNIGFRLYAKLEGANPGGSIKDRTALSILNNALDEGLIRFGGTVIESSSGNMGIGLAQACRYFGLRFVCVVDPKTTSQNIEILKAYGAEVDLVAEPDPVTGGFLQARIDRVNALRQSISGSFWCNQYANRFNPKAHRKTMEEIVNELNGELDYLFCATSTCGTLRGCAEYLRERGMTTKIVAVDAFGSVIFGGRPAERLIPGHGAARRPELFQSGLADRCIHVSDLECVVGCRRLLRREAILAGGSSGAVLSAVDKARADIPANATCAVILCDRGERYLDTIYSDSWVTNHFGAVSELWQD
jgi:2,3-diaminopropionate biosynthesis protein SbnA